jgi:hypothetical protein
MIPLLTNTPICKIQQISKHPILTYTLNNIESNTKTLFNENGTRLLRKIVYGV